MKLKVKINGQWHSVRTLSYYIDENHDNFKVATPPDIEDVGDEHVKYSFDELSADQTEPIVLADEYTCEFGDENSIAEYEATIAPLVERISELEHYRASSEKILTEYRREVLQYRSAVDAISKRLVDAEEILRQIIRTLEIEESSAIDEFGKEISTTYSSAVLGNIIDRIASLEAKTAKTNKLYNLIKEINNNENQD